MFSCHSAEKTRTLLHIVWEAGIVKCNFRPPYWGPIFFESYSSSDYKKVGPQKKNCGGHHFSGHFRFRALNPIFAPFQLLFLHYMILNPTLCICFLHKKTWIVYLKLNYKDLVRIRALIGLLGPKLTKIAIFGQKGRLKVHIIDFKWFWLFFLVNLIRLVTFLSIFLHPGT